MNNFQLSGRKTTSSFIKAEADIFWLLMTAFSSFLSYWDLCNFKVYVGEMDFLVPLIYMAISLVIVFLLMFVVNYFIVIWQKKNNYFLEFEKYQSHNKRTIGVKISRKRGGIENLQVQLLDAKVYGSPLSFKDEIPSFVQRFPFDNGEAFLLAEALYERTRLLIATDYKVPLRDATEEHPNIKYCDYVAKIKVSGKDGFLPIEKIFTCRFRHLCEISPEHDVIYMATNGETINLDGRLCEFRNFEILA